MPNHQDQMNVLTLRVATVRIGEFGGSAGGGNQTSGAANDLFRKHMIQLTMRESIRNVV